MFSATLWSKLIVKILVEKVNVVLHVAFFNFVSKLKNTFIGVSKLVKVTSTKGKTKITEKFPRKNSLLLLSSINII